MGKINRSNTRFLRYESKLRLSQEPRAASSESFSGVTLKQVIHIVDDDPYVRASTSFLLASCGFSTRIYERGDELLRQADLDEGCILLDLRMHPVSGLDVLAALRDRGGSAPVIMLTGHGDVASAVQALKLGAVDFIEKPYEEGQLLDAIARAFAAGRRDARLVQEKRAALEQVETLSAREKQVLRGLLGGMTNKEMARLLDLSPRTIEMHRSTMMADLGVDAAADAIRIAIAADLAPLEDDAPEVKAAPPAAPPRLRPQPLEPVAITPCDSLRVDDRLQIVLVDQGGERRIAIRAGGSSSATFELVVTDPPATQMEDIAGQLDLPFVSRREREAERRDARAPLLLGHASEAEMHAHAA